MSQTIRLGVSTYELVVAGYDTIADLRTQPLGDTPDWTKRSLALTHGDVTAFDGNLRLYCWDPDSILADSPPDVIKPDNITGPGRWLQVSSNGGGSGSVSVSVIAGTPTLDGANYLELTYNGTPYKLALVL